MTPHAAAEPSAWVRRWAPCVPPGPVLDLACGGGRHARLFIARGHPVAAVDRQRVDLPGAEFIQADLEDGSPWPLAGRRFAGIVVTNYLHRALFPLIADALAEGGVLIYETFMRGNERHGRPSSPEFLLQPGELLSAFAALSPLGFEQGQVEHPKPAVVQRLVAVRGAAADTRIDIEEPPSPDIAAEWNQEIERRVAAHAQGEAETDSAEQVFEEARRIAP